jgi:hypothetical protein
MHVRLVLSNFCVIIGGCEYALGSYRTKRICQDKGFHLLLGNLPRTSQAALDVWPAPADTLTHSPFSFGDRSCLATVSGGSEHMERSLLHLCKYHGILQVQCDGLLSIRRNS